MMKLEILPVFEVLKPYVENCFAKIRKYRVSLVLALIALVAVWFYFDYVEQQPLNKNGAVGFFIIFLLTALFSEYLVRRVLQLFVIVCAVAYSMIEPVYAKNFDLKVIEVESTGNHSFDLRIQSLFIFPFELKELYRTDKFKTDEQNTECILLTRSGKSDFSVKFCGYAEAFNSGTGSIIAGSDGKTAYAYDLYELESGGGGNFGTLFEIPNTSLKQYLDSKNLEIELLARSILPIDHKEFKSAYAKFGLYGFVLFRDKSNSGISDRIKVANSFLKLLPDFDVDTFGVPRNEVGVLIYPATITSENLYTIMHAGGFYLDNSCQINCDAVGFVKHYNHKYATFALKLLKKATGIDPPEISVVFVPMKNKASSKDKFFLSNLEWEKSLVFNLDKSTNVDNFFVELNNALTFGLFDKKPNLIGQIRNFAESTGRLALIVFGD